MNEFFVKVIKGIIAIVIGTVIATLTPFEGLQPATMTYMGILVAMILFMVFRIYPDYVVGLGALAACVTFGVADFKVIFGQFSDSTIWLVFLFIAFGVGIAKSGLLTRLAYSILAPFPQTFQGQILALMSTSTVLAPLIPNPQAKIALLAPLVGSIAQENKFEKGSKGASGLFSAFFIPTSSLTTAFLSGTAMVFMLIGFLPEELRGGFTWIRWLTVTGTWFVVHLILLYFFIVKKYQPKGDYSLPTGFAKKKLKELGPLSQVERTALIIMAVTIVSWIAEPLTGISIFTTAIVAVIALWSTNMLQPVDMQTKYPWILVLTIGTIMAMASLLMTTGVNEWLSPLIYSVVSPYITNIYILIFAVCVVTFLLRYAIFSILAVTLIVYAVFAPIGAAMGVHPILILFVAYGSAQVFNLSFHNVSYLQAVGMTGYDMIEFKGVVSTSYAYMVIQMVACMASIPVWRLIGLIS